MGSIKILITGTFGFIIVMDFGFITGTFESLQGFWIHYMDFEFVAATLDSLQRLFITGTFGFIAATLDSSCEEAVQLAEHYPGTRLCLK